MTYPVDTSAWYNGDAPAQWVMAQAAGRGNLADASADYIPGVIHFANDVRGVFECGAGPPDAALLGASVCSPAANAKEYAVR